MKFHTTALLLLATMAYACTGTRSNQESVSNKTTSGTPETSGGGMVVVDNNRHYVVNMKFTKEQVMPESGVQEAGEATLLVIPSSEMFLAIYEGGQLTYYYDFPNPLRSQGSGGAGSVQASASGSVWFPAWMADKNRAANADVGIYTVTGYTDAFADQVQTNGAMKNALSKGTFSKTYAINGTNIAAFLSGIK